MSHVSIIELSLMVMFVLYAKSAQTAATNRSSRAPQTQSDHTAKQVRGSDSGSDLAGAAISE